MTRRELDRKIAQVANRLDQRYDHSTQKAQALRDQLLLQFYQSPWLVIGGSVLVLLAWRQWRRLRRLW